MSAEERKPGTLVVALAAALVVCLAFGVWTMVENRRQAAELAEVRKQAQALSEEQQAGKDATAAAAAFVAEVTTYSYKKGEHDFAWVDRLNDPEVRERYEPGVPGLQKFIRDSRTRAEGKVIESAARVLDPTQVEVIAFVDQALLDKDDCRGTPCVEESRVALTMRLVDGEWLVQDIRFLNDLGTGGTP